MKTHTCIMGSLDGRFTGERCKETAMQGSDYCAHHIDAANMCLVRFCPKKGDETHHICIKHWEEYRVSSWATVCGWLANRKNSQSERLSSASFVVLLLASQSDLPFWGALGLLGFLALVATLFERKASRGLCAGCDLEKEHCVCLPCPYCKDTGAVELVSGELGECDHK